MGDHVMRMRQELMDLETKIYKLTEFLTDTTGVFAGLSGPDQLLLLHQSFFMGQYRDILKMRIGRAVHG